MTTGIKPKENQLIVTISDPAQMNSIKKAISLIRGVEKVNAPTKRRPRKTGIEQALEDVKAGRVTHWNSVDEMFDELSN